MNLALILALTAVAGGALPKPVHIRAGEVHFDQKTGDGFYRRKVQLRQDGVRINASEARVVQRKGRLAEVHAKGVPVQFEYEEPGEEILKLRAETLYYDASAQRLELTGNVHMDQGPDHITGHQMIYHMTEDRLVVSSGTAPVTAELAPAKKKRKKAAP